MRIEGREIVDKVFQELQKKAAELIKRGVTPHLAVILIGESPASVAYVRQKEKKGELIGAKVTVLRYDVSVTNETLITKVKELSADKSVHGILIQRPVPGHIDVEKLVELTAPQKDLDGFHQNSPYTLPLPLSVIKILEEIYQIICHPELDSGSHDTFNSWLKSQKIIIIGKGPTGGGPVIAYFKKLGLNPTVIDSKTQQPKQILKQADIIISCVGRENIIKSDMLKKGVILIGVGISRGTDGKLHGDYNESEIENIASFYTPTPGGVGPVNVAMLMDNLLKAADKQN